jgi:pimeloyl-ACP methyl ester carboxylesterase
MIVIFLGYLLGYGILAIVFIIRHEQVLSMHKPMLVLLPGLLCDSYVWKHQIAALQDHAHIIIPHINQFNNEDDIIEHIIAISPPRFYLAGHSMGGWLAIELMRKYSDRVLKLCILATSAELDSAKKMRLRKKSIDLFSTLPGDELANYLAGFYAYKPEVKQAIIDMFKRNIVTLVSQQQTNIQRRCCKDILPTINVPTTVLVGQQDKEFFTSTKYIADHIRKATFVVIKDCGHMLLQEQPEYCTSIMLDWFNSPV